MMRFVFHLVNVILRYWNWLLPSIQKGTFQRWRMPTFLIFFFTVFAFQIQNADDVLITPLEKFRKEQIGAAKVRDHLHEPIFLFVCLMLFLSQLWVDRNDIRRNPAECCWKAVLVAQSICCWSQSRLQRTVWAYCYQLYFHSWPKLRPEM